MNLVVQELILSFPTAGRTVLIPFPSAREAVRLVVSKHHCQPQGLVPLRSFAASPLLFPKY